MKITDCNVTELDSKKSEAEFKRLDNLWYNKILDKIFPHGIYVYRASHMLFRPWKILDYTWDEVRYAWQRVFRGWDDTVAWSLDWYLAKMIPVWLKELKKNRHGLPGTIFEDKDLDEIGNSTPEGEIRAEIKWNDILDKIIHGFEVYAELEHLVFTDLKEYEKDKEAFEEGFDLFRKYFGNFWD
jgi:hypothetical protein